MVVETQLPDALAVLEYASDAVFVSRWDFTIEYVNGAAESLTKHPRTWLVGRNLAELMVPEDLARQPWRKAELKVGATLITERTMRCGDGNVILCEISSSKLPDGRVVGIVRDMTGRAEEKRRLARSEASFRSLADRMPDGVCIHRNGRFVFCNKVVVEQLGFDRADELIGTPVIEVIHPDSRPVVIKRLQQLAAGERELPFLEERVVRRDGTSVLMEIAAVQIEFQGEPAVVVVTRDLTERKKLQARVAQADRMASIGTLAAGIGHEVNNPLAYLALNLEAARREVDNARAGEAGLTGGALATLAERIDAALEGAGRVRDIVANLRRFARTDELPRAPTVVAHAIDAAIKLIEHELRLRARVVREVAADAAVRINEGQLTQVFVNLLANSAHAIPEGQADLHEIAVRAEVRGDEVVARVTDTGVGIPAAQLPRIFDPFFTTKPVGAGTGLGLSICHGIVTAAGGRIEATSAPGAGTTITVALPVATPTTADADAATAPVRPSEPSFAARAAANKPRVLLVDDEQAIRTVLAKILREEAYDVEEAASGKAAIARLSTGADVDVIMCDLTMPDVSGADVYRWIEAHRPALAERVIFISGADDELASRFPDRWLDKPFTIEGLLRVVGGRLTVPP